MKNRPIFNSIITMIILNLIVFLSTITLHELGHVIAGKFMKCDGVKAVIFDSKEQTPYTELECYNVESHEFAYLSGLMLTTLFSFSFLFFTEKSQRNMFWVVLGLGIFFASLDIVTITGVEIMRYLCMAISLVFLVIGEVLTGISFEKY